jgi:hypothetical protein
MNTHLDVNLAFSADFERFSNKGLLNGVPPAYELLRAGTIAAENKGGFTSLFGDLNAIAIPASSSS